MGIIKGYIDRMKRAEKKIPSIVRKAIVSNQAFILSTLKHDQLGQGIDGFGKTVGKYAPSTQEYYAKKNPKPRTSKVAGQPYNFEWTGKNFDSMKLKVKGEEFDVKSILKEELDEIFGTKLNKLTEENMIFVWEKVIEPEVYKFIFNSPFGL